LKSVDFGQIALASKTLLRGALQNLRRASVKFTPMRLRPFLLTIALLQCVDAGARVVDRRILPENPHYRRNANCTTIAVAQQASMPVSQGDSAICYAYATSDMISQRIGRRVSALDVATSYFFANPVDLYKARNKQLRQYLAERPRLLDDILLRRDRIDVSKESNANGRPYFDKLEDGDEEIASLLVNIKGVCLDRDLPSDDGYYKYTALFERLRRKAKLLGDRRLCLRAVGGEAKHLHDPVADAFNASWIGFVDQRCRRTRSPVPLLPVAFRAAVDERDAVERRSAGQEISAQEKAHMFEIIDYALDHRRNPTIGYSFYLLEARAPNDPDEYADHSSMILARKKIDGVCHYLVQDNTGEYCFRLRPTIAAKCRLGRIWVAEHELGETIYSVIYLR
jgi:hypothetical protein